jgi:hypothetical protein
VPTLHLETGRIAWAEVPNDDLLVSPLGWTRDDQLVIGSRDRSSRRLATLELIVDDGTAWDGVVGLLPGTGVSHVEVATSLMTQDRPTVDRPEPDWPWGVERRAAIGTVSGAVVLGLGLLLWTRRRRW